MLGKANSLSGWHVAYNGRRKRTGITTVHWNSAAEGTDSPGAPGRRSSITSRPGHVTDASAGKWDWFLLFLSPSLFSWCFILQAFNCFFFFLSLHPECLSLISRGRHPDFLQQSRVLPEFLCVHVRLQRTFQRAWTSCKNPNTCSCQFC